MALWEQPAAEAPGIEDLPPDESESFGAGVFLLLGPLARIGFAEWLAAVRDGLPLGLSPVIRATEVEESSTVALHLV